MDLSELYNHFSPILFERLSYGNKTTVLLRDFNANLLNYDIDTDILDFLDYMFCNSLLPHITSPTRITLARQVYRYTGGIMIKQMLFIKTEL